ncbi:MAG: hypothetical protein AAF197_01580 [Pseudomonadota bacterium]
MTLLWILSATATASDEKELATITPGKLLSIEIDKSSAELPIARFGLNNVVVLDRKTYWRILCGISLDTLPGRYLVYYHGNPTQEQPRSLNFTVEPSPPDSLNAIVPLSDLSADVPNALMSQTLTTTLEFENSSEPSLPFITPINNANREVNETQLAIDDSGGLWMQLNPTLDSQIIAPSHGIVSAITKNDLGWFKVILDHGRGALSVIATKAPLLVKVGSGVTRNQALTRSFVNEADTTAPASAYWQVVLNKATIDPLELVHSD